MKTLLNQRFNKENKIVLACIVIFIVSSIAFIQYQAGDSIVGTWISTDDPDNKWVFTNNQKAKSYYEGELLDTYTYRVSSTSPQCGEVVQTGPRIEFLELTHSADGEQKCFYINSLDDENLSLSPFDRANILLFERQ